MSGLQRLLCVDDDPDIRALLALVLRDLGGLEVRCCAGGREALAMLDEVVPDLLVLDVMMPGMDGFETLEAIRRHPRGADLPVVFLTARGDDPALAGTRRTGVLAVVPKPFDPLDFPDRLRRLYDAYRSPHGTGVDGTACAFPGAGA